MTEKVFYDIIGKVIVGNLAKTKIKRKKSNQENDYEKNLSTQEKTEKQSTRLPQKNGYDGGKKGA